MLGPHLKKLLLIIPLLVVLSFIVFFARSVVPQDPVEQSLGVFQQEDTKDLPYSSEEYYKEAKKLGLDKPSFYFSLRPNYLPKEYNQLLLPQEKKIAKQLLKAGIKWISVSKFIDTKSWQSNPRLISDIVKELSTEGYTGIDYSILNPNQSAAIEQLTIDKISKFYYPAFHWNGTNNQYQQWISKMFDGNTLKSVHSNTLVMPKIKKAILWTLSISILSIIFSYGLGIFLGFKQISSGHVIWKRIQTIFDVFFTMPLFWLATLAVVFFTTSDYGKWTNIFPSVHSMDFSSKSMLEQLRANVNHLLLPIICMVFHSTGYISGIMASNLKAQLNKPHILTAKQKGLSNKEIIKSHGMKNALFPILTLLTGSIPSAISGSLILEIIFNIPGVGRLMYNSILLADWNIVFPLVLITGLVTALSYWIADILYESFDPRLKTS